MESSEQLIKRDEMINQTQSDNPEFNAPTGSFINDQKCVEEAKKPPEKSKKPPEESKKIQAVSKSFVCVLIGPIGHGKSTLINYLANYLRDGTLENRKVVIPTDYYKLVTENGFNHSERNPELYLSQTENCSSYEFLNRKDNCKYIFIDTLGLSGASGPHQDNRNIQKILNFLNMTKKINAIIIVQNGNYRLDLCFKNAYERLKNSLPLSISENIALILTNLAESASINENCIPLSIKKSYMMDNVAFNVKLEDFSKMSRFKKIILNYKWELSMEVIEELIEDLSQYSEASTRD
ncbi:unnamed protein product [Blepharisma stoltei]|uniref:G domain-containing protein n=1 Tax=Blepharisma stoltei TaxID=1481888 RepID=A0AAU9IBQ4_9CILI|nr:unnamed protein product [Blepharisma stoltei]